jgi:hypothetical protein
MVDFRAMVVKTFRNFRVAIIGTNIILGTILTFGLSSEKNMTLWLVKIPPRLLALTQMMMIWK